MVVVEEASRLRGGPGVGGCVECSGSRGRPYGWSTERGGQSGRVLMITHYLSTGSRAHLCQVRSSPPPLGSPAKPRAPGGVQPHGPGEKGMMGVPGPT